mmetsp:Transcript_33738/g.79550  ORF Transcript_33738/g.79550 Transcript_33738/m.79550 type:complete len:424 (-) Transcript_33738:266-1537(-)
MAVNVMSGAVRKGRFAIYVLFAVVLATDTAGAIPSSAEHSAASTGSIPDSVSGSNPDAIDAHDTIVSQPRTRNDVDRLIQESLDTLSASMNEFHAATAHPRRRPFVTLTYAQSIDGKIALRLDHEMTTSSTTTSQNLAISGPESFRLTHALRSIHDAILVGGNTLAIDNPRLSNRLWDTATVTESPVPPSADSESNDESRYRSPRPVVLDTHLTHTRRLGSTMRATNLIVCCSREAFDRAILDGYNRGDGNSHSVNHSISNSDSNSETKEERTDESNNGHPILHSVTLLPCKTTTATPFDHRTDGDKRVVLDLSDVLSSLYEIFGIRSVMVEGGAGVISQFVASNYCHDENDKTIHRKEHSYLVDCLCVTISPQLFGSRGLDSISSSPAIGSKEGRGRFGPLRCIALGDDCVLFSDWQQPPPL